MKYTKSHRTYLENAFRALDYTFTLMLYISRHLSDISQFVRMRKHRIHLWHSCTPLFVRSVLSH